MSLSFDMVFQTQCCVLLTILITITAGVPLPSPNDDTAAVSSSCPPCITPKNLPDECIYKVMARDPNTGAICPYCVNLCRSTIKTVKESSSSKTALGNVASAKSGNSRITKKSNKERKATKTNSKSKRRSSRRKKSNKSSRKSISRSNKIAANSRGSNKRSKIQNRPATGRKSLLKNSKRQSKTPLVQLAYGKSTPDKVSPLVKSSRSKSSRDGMSNLKTSQRNSRRTKVRSMNHQSTDSFANEPLSWPSPRDRSYLSSSKRRSNKRHRGRNLGRSYNRNPSMSGRSYNGANNGAWNGYYDNGYDDSGYDSRENGRNDDRYDSIENGNNGDYSNNNDWSAQGLIGGWDDSYNGSDRSDENDSNSDNFEGGNIMAKASIHGGSSSAENDNRSPVKNTYRKGWNRSDQSSSENGSDSSNIDD